MLVGGISMCVALGLFAYASCEGRAIHHTKKEYPAIGIILILLGSTFMAYTVGSLLVFLIGILLPFSGELWSFICAILTDSRILLYIRFFQSRSFTLRWDCEASRTNWSTRSRDSDWSVLRWAFSWSSSVLSRKSLPDLKSHQTTFTQSLNLHLRRYCYHWSTKILHMFSYKHALKFAIFKFLDSPCTRILSFVCGKLWSNERLTTSETSDEQCE